MPNTRPPLRRFVCYDKVLEKGLNALVEEINRWNKAQSDGLIGFINDDVGPRWHLNYFSAAGQITKAKAPSGGVAAKSGNTPGSATCTLYTWDGTSEVLGTNTVTVKNSYATAVGANKDIWIVARTRNGGSSTDWFVLTEAC